MNSIGNMCYCYEDECNQKEWEKQGHVGKKQWICISFFKFKGENTPKCPYCKKKMTVTANFEED
jgi:hypothetical protein